MFGVSSLITMFLTSSIKSQSDLNQPSAFALCHGVDELILTLLRQRHVTCCKQEDSHVVR